MAKSEMLLLLASFIIHLIWSSSVCITKTWYGFQTLKSSNQTSGNSLTLSLCFAIVIWKSPFACERYQKPIICTTEKIWFIEYKRPIKIFKTDIIRVRLVNKLLYYSSNFICVHIYLHGHKFFYEIKIYILRIFNQ